jgi:hypothetical protein
MDTGIIGRGYAGWIRGLGTGYDQATESECEKIAVKTFHILRRDGLHSALKSQASGRCIS